MANFKYTATFSDSNRSVPSGWSENFILIGYASLSTALVKAQAIRDKRVMLLGAGVRNTGLKVSDITINGDSLIAEALEYPPFRSAYNSAFGDLSVVGAEKPADFGWTTQNIRATFQNARNKATYYLRGIPDFSTNTKLNRNIDAAVLAAWDVYKAELLNSERVGAVVIDQSVPFARIADVNCTTERIVTLDDPGLAPYDVVYIRKVRGGNMPRGYYRVKTVVTPLSFEIYGHNWGGLIPPCEYLGGGEVRKRVYTVLPFQDLVFASYGSHKIGRPSKVSRGRSTRTTRRLI